MTREEAIKWLEYSKGHYEGLDYGAPRIALDMAISALREQKSLEEKQATSDERQKTSDWISVKDRLPENDGDMFLVLVTGHYNSIRFNYAYELAYYYQGDGWCLEQYPLYENPGVTHWAPLPEPQKGMTLKNGLETD